MIRSEETAARCLATASLSHLNRFQMKKQTLTLNKKLFMVKKVVASLNADEQLHVQGGSLTCHTKEPMGCTADATTPGVNGCILTAKPSLIIAACTTQPVTVGCPISS